MSRWTVYRNKDLNQILDSEGAKPTLTISYSWLALALALAAGAVLGSLTVAFILIPRVDHYQNKYEESEAVVVLQREIITRLESKNDAYIEKEAKKICDANKRFDELNSELTRALSNYERMAACRAGLETALYSGFLQAKEEGQAGDAARSFFKELDKLAKIVDSEGGK